MWAIADFISNWTSSRNWRDFLWGMPSVVVAVAALVISQYGRSASQGNLVRRYTLAAEAAFAENDLAAASVYVRKLALLGEDGNAVQYGLARLAEAQGHRDRARELMAVLVDSGTYAPAQHWMANDLLVHQQLVSRDDLELAQQHLQAAIGRLPSERWNAEAEILLGHSHRMSGDFDAAISLFRPHLHTDPELRLTVASLYRQQGDASSARRQAEEARSYYQQQVEADPSDQRAKLFLAEAELLAGRFSESIRLLLKQFSETRDDRLRDDISHLLVLAADVVAEGSNNNLELRLELVRDALRFAPYSPTVHRHLVQLASLDGETADRARAIVDGLVQRGEASGPILTYLGTAAITEGNLTEAREHLEAAYRKNPFVPVVNNNLAWLLAHADPPQLELALKLVNTAIRLSPNQVEYRETRGQILLKLQRWEEARADLELCLQVFPDRRDVQNSLALAKEQIAASQVPEEGRAETPE